MFLFSALLPACFSRPGNDLPIYAHTALKHQSFSTSELCPLLHAHIKSPLQPHQSSPTPSLATKLLQKRSSQHPTPCAPLLGDLCYCHQLNWVTILTWTHEVLGLEPTERRTQSTRADLCSCQGGGQGTPSLQLLRRNDLQGMGFHQPWEGLMFLPVQCSGKARSAMACQAHPQAHIQAHRLTPGRCLMPGAGTAPMRRTALILAGVVGRTIAARPWPDGPQGSSHLSLTILYVPPEFS